MNWFKKKIEQATFKQQFNFKKKYSFNERENKRKMIDSKYIGQRSRGICYLIVQKSLFSSIQSFKTPYKMFAIDNGMKILDLITYIRKNLKMSQKQSVFLIIGKSIANSNYTIGQLYQIYSQPDGFLYVTLSQSQVF